MMPEPTNPPTLDEIEERHKRDEEYLPAERSMPGATVMRRIHADRAHLLAEVRRLREHINESGALPRSFIRQYDEDQLTIADLRAQLAAQAHRFSEMQREIQDAVDVAAANVADLRAQLEARTGIDYAVARHHDSPPNEVTIGSALGQRDRALAQLEAAERESEHCASRIRRMLSDELPDEDTYRDLPLIHDALNCIARRSAPRAETAQRYQRIGAVRAMDAAIRAWKNAGGDHQYSTDEVIEVLSTFKREELVEEIGYDPAPPPPTWTRAQPVDRIKRNMLAEAFIRGIEAGADDPACAGDGDAMYQKFREWAEHPEAEQSQADETSPTWTRERPTEAGLYLCAHDRVGTAVLDLVSDGLFVVIDSGELHSPHDLDGALWFGPLPDPPPLPGPEGGA